MSRYGIATIVLSLLLCGCETSARPGAEEGILQMIKTLQEQNQPSGYCERRALYKDGIKLPFHMLICVD